MTNPVTPSQFYWTRQACDTLKELSTLEKLDLDAAQIEHKAARHGKSCIRRVDVESFYGYCQEVR